MKKEIRFSTSVDTAEFDRAFDHMRKKLDEIYQKSDRSRSLLESRQIAQSGGLGRPATEGEKTRAFQEDLRQRRELGLFIKDQIREQERLTKQLEIQQKLKENINKLDKEKIKLAEEAIKKTTAEIDATASAIKVAAQARQMPGFEGVGGFGGVGERAAGMFGYMRSKGAGIGRSMGIAGMAGIRGLQGLAAANPALFGAGVAAAGAAAYNLGNFAAEAPGAAIMAQGSAAQSATRGMQDVFQDKAFERYFFRLEESRARKAAKEEFDQKRAMDAAAVGAASLALARSAGSPSGMLATGSAVVGSMLVSERFRNKFLGGLGFESFQTKYEADMVRQQAEAAEAYRQKFIESDPLRLETFKRFAAEAPQNVAIQRALGIGDEELKQIYGGGAGRFTMGTIRQNISGILGAGGSTRAARGLAGEAAILGRDKDITNAAELMGVLSGAMGSAESTRSSLKKLLEESMKTGLDKSEFAEENRKFLQASTQYIVSSGARTPEDAARLSERFSQFLAEKTTEGIRGAQTAAQISRAITGEAGGARGVIQAAGFLSDKTFSGMGTRELQALMSISEEEFLAGTDEAKSLISRIKEMPGNENLTDDEILQKIRQVKRRTFAPGEYTAAESARQNLIEKAAGRTPEELSQDPEFMKQFGKFQTDYMRTYIEGFGRMTEQTKRSLTFGQLGLNLPTPEGAGREGIPEYLKEPSDVPFYLRGPKPAERAKRAADLLEESTAAGQQPVIESINQFSSSLDTSSEKVRIFADTLVTIARQVATATSTKDFGTMRQTLSPDALSAEGDQGMVKSYNPATGAWESQRQPTAQGQGG